MASIHKKGTYCFIAYIDADKKRHFVSSGILHTPPGLTPEDTKEKKGQNEAKAKVQAIEMEQLASISTVMEWTNAKAVSEDQAKSISSFLLLNQGMGTGWLASPEATRNGLWACLSKVDRKSTRLNS